MSRIAPVLTALVLAGCSTPPPPTATVTLFGPDGRMESWRTCVVEDVHVHPASADGPCPASLMRAAGPMTGAFPGARKERAEELTRAMGSVMERSCPALLGPAYGGRNRVAVVLRGADEALAVDLPRLKPDETDRVFKVGEFSAAFERPLRTTEAALDRGWVRVTRKPSDRLEMELFLVLKPVRPGASYESMQVVTRVSQ